MVRLTEYFWTVEISPPELADGLDDYLHEIVKERSFSPSEAYISLLQAWLDFDLYSEKWGKVTGKLWVKDGEKVTLCDGIWFGDELLLYAEILKCKVSEIVKMTHYMIGFANAEIKKLEAGQHIHLDCEARYYTRQLKMKLFEWTKNPSAFPFLIH